MEQKIDTVIYHKNCNDGHAAAMVANYFLKQSQPDIKVEFIAMHPQSEAPDVTGKYVIVLDLSFNFEQTLKMIEQASFFKCIDHHKTAQAALENIPEENKLFDMSKCGATLTWFYFTGGLKEIPLFLQYIEDRDIWTQKLPYTNEVYELYNMKPKDSFEYFEDLMNNDSKVESLVEKSKEIKEYKDASVTRIVKKANIHVLNIKGDLKVVAYYNTPIYIDEVGHTLLKTYPCADFAVNYQHNTSKEETYFSFRSDDDREDVSRIAALMEGGGHRNASGAKAEGLICKLPFKHMDANLVYDISTAERETVIWDECHYTGVRVEMSQYTINFSRSMIDLLKTKFEDIEGILYYNEKQTEWFLNFETYSFNTKIN